MMDTQKTSDNELEAAYHAALAAGGRPLMPLYRSPKKPKSRWPDAIALIFVGLVIALVVYPVWEAMHPDNRMRGVVLDENKRPIPFAQLRIRDAEGHDLDTATTDANGEVLWKREWVGEGKTFGEYGLTIKIHSTGGRDHVYLARLVQHRVRVKNAVTGLPEAGLCLDVVPDGHTLYVRNGGWFNCETNEKGGAALGTFPSTARMQFQVKDGPFVVWNVLPTVSTNYKIPPYQTTVTYDVTVVPAGAVSGRVVYPDGSPVDKGLVFTYLVDAGPNGENFYQKLNLRADKTFRLSGLAPGRYRLGFEAWWGARDSSAGGREVFVQSGKTTFVDPPLRVRWPVPKP